MSNPNWTKDELILLIELYHRLRGQHIDRDNSLVKELSCLLNQLPIHDSSLRDAAFRNPVGVAMKLRNLQRLDPDAAAAGLRRGGQLEAAVWDEFRGNLPRLRNTARAIRACYRDLLTPSVTTSAFYDPEAGYGEGSLLTRVHVLRERSTTAALRKKQEVMRSSGCLKCEICGFASCEAYGELGEGFAECHHTVPLASLDQRRRTRMADLAIVCANCHRMLHRGIKWRSVLELQSLVRLRQSANSMSGWSSQTIPV